MRYRRRPSATTGLLDTLTYPVSTSGQSLVLKVELPPGLELFLEGQKINRLPPTYTPEQPVPPVPKGPVQSPVNPSITPPPGQPGWLWWQVFHYSLGGL